MNKDIFYNGIYLLLVAIFFYNILGINANIVLIIISIFSSIFAYNLNKKNTKESERQSKLILNINELNEKDSYLKYKQIITLMNNIPFAMLLLNINGEFVIANKLINEFSIIDKESTYLNNNLPIAIKEAIKDTFILEKSFDKVINVNNKEYQFLSSAVTVNGKYNGCVITIQDISVVVQGEKIQKQFIADASHELKTPIAAIKGMLEIINREDFNDDETRTLFLKQIEHENRRLELLVSDLLNISRLNSSNLALKRSKIDIKSLVENNLDVYNTLIKNKDINIKLNFNNEDKIFADISYINILINNLVVNAINYSDSGIIEIGSYMEEDKYCLYISDQGVGISKEELDNVFNRFYRIDKARTRETGGNGLGLSIVKGIVDAHNATIDIESEVNKGSKFIIKFK